EPEMGHIHAPPGGGGSHRQFSCASTFITLCGHCSRGRSAMQEQAPKEVPSAAGRHVSQLTRNTYAIVLAGGRGSRLMQLTDWRAKPAVPFGGKFRIIDFALSNCVNSGIRRIGVATQYKAQSLIRHIQHAWSFLEGRFHEGVDLMPAQQMMGE